MKVLQGPSILESCKKRSFKLLAKTVVVTTFFKSKKEKISKRTHLESELSLSIRFFPSSPLSRVSLRIFADEGSAISKDMVFNFRNFGNSGMRKWKN